MAIRVIIADDHEAVRRGLARFVQNTDIVIVAEASNGTEVVDRAAELQPDVAVVDVRLPDANGIDVVEQLKSRLPALPVVVFSAYDNPTYVARMGLAGASDYVLKNEPRERILEAIRRAATRQPPAEEGLLASTLEIMRRRRTELVESFPLTQREFQVLRHVAFGLSNREIGKSLNISVETVKEHVQNILRKIDASDRTQAAVWAVRQNMVQ